MFTVAWSASEIARSTAIGGGGVGVCVDVGITVNVTVRLEAGVRDGLTAGLTASQAVCNKASVVNRMAQIM
jgi:hypothetical protein